MKICKINEKSTICSAFDVAESVGFEPTEAFTSMVFKTTAFDRSANSPYILSDKARVLSAIYIIHIFLFFASDFSKLF